MEQKLKVSAGTIVRTNVLPLALLNQVLVSTGHAVLNVDEGTITQLVNAAITIIAAVWAWWKNNSFTQPALYGDETMNALRKE